MPGVFYKDTCEEIFVAVRWYEMADANANTLIDPIAKLAKLKLASIANSRSYGIMAIRSSIVKAEYLQNI
jgi:hypothetical protein